MTSYELHINGIICDLASDANVVLVYQNGIFTALDAIQSNRSFNIDLPLTPRNIEAVKFAQRPDIESNTPYIKLPSSLYRGGVPIFNEGQAVITEISDVISVTLTWGNVDNFDPLFDSELAELADTLKSMGYGHIAWNENSQIVTAPSESSPTPSMGFFAVDFGMGYSNIRYMHPSIMVGRVLEAIEQFHGIKIDGKERLMNTHLLPCVSKNGDRVSASQEDIKFSFEPHIVSSGRPAEGLWIEPGVSVIKLPDRLVDGIVQNGTWTFDIKGDELIQSGWMFDIKGADFIQVTLDITIVTKNTLTIGPYIADTDNLYTRLSSFPIVSLGPVNGSIYHGVKATVTLSKEGGNWPKGSSIALVMSTVKDTSWFGSVTMKVTPRERVHFPSIYPIAPNLPDMSQGEFIAALMALSGQFAYADKDAPNTIKIISADDILANMTYATAADWSAKVLLNEKRIIGMPDASEFSIEDYAQKNILDYDNDDDVETDTAGVILIPNVNLEKETELTDMSFSASDNSQTTNGRKVGLIPLYTKDDGYKDDADEYDKQQHIQYNELSPRILSWYQDYAPNSELTRWLYGYFPSSMQFGGASGIVATKYAGLKRILQRLRIITVRARLSALDLYNLDYSKPVYIAQFGAFFAIYSITTGENDICECKLIQLPN